MSHDEYVHSMKEHPERRNHFSKTHSVPRILVFVYVVFIIWALTFLYLNFFPELMKWL
jgi:hypothetical protein